MERSKNSPSWSARLPRMSPARAFSAIFMGVFLFIFLGSALVTFLMPETYSATARVSAPSEAHLELLQSTKLLEQVSQQLNLASTYAARYGESKPMDHQRVEDLLRRSLHVRRVRGTDLVEIRLDSRSAIECAQVASEIADTGVRLAGMGPGAIRIVEQPAPPLRPSRPNKSLNLTLGALVGIFLGTMAGGVGAKLAVGFDGLPTAKA